MAPLQFVLNGRFFQRPVTGVERLALELSRALQSIVATDAQPASFEVVAPSGTAIATASLTPPDLSPPAHHILGKLQGHAWEQVELARYRKDAWLLSLCNTGPIVRRRQAVVICDAQFILHPESYSRAFRWWYRVMMSAVARRATAVFTISEFSKSQLERYRIIPPGKAHVLRLGVDHLAHVLPDPDTLERYGLTRQPYILATGSLARHKNLAMLIEAFNAADLTGINLVVAGGGNARVFASAGVIAGDAVRFLGRISDGELRALYTGARAFACPSLSEGFGFTPLEAMSAGCPVIATTGGAVPEVCADAALYADPHDPMQWRDALRRIASDPALGDDLARRGLTRAATFRWTDTAHQMLNVLTAYDAEPG